MPKKEMDYSKCVIYKIQHKDNNDLLYVGHTTNFTKRKYQHKCNISTNDKYNIKLYQMIRENGGWDDFNMIVVKEFPCENKQQATTEEDKIMREMKATMNTNRALKTLIDIYEDKKKYRIIHKEQIKEHKHQYYENNKSFIIEKSKMYYEEHKEQIKDKTKIYNQPRRIEQYICECGGKYHIQHKAVHLRTKKHINFLNPCINIDPPSSSQPELVSS
jgi:hypothetical protein